MEVLVSEDSGQGVRAHTQGRAGGKDQALYSGLCFAEEETEAQRS